MSEWLLLIQAGGGMDSLLSQLPNGGGFVGVIVVVVLFLRKQDASETSMKEIVKSFTAETTASRSEYRAHVSEIMQQGLNAHKETREAIRALYMTLEEIRKNKIPNDF